LATTLHYGSKPELPGASTPGDSLGEVRQALTTVSNVRALTLEQAYQGPEVHLRGVVTAHPGYKSSFFVQDSTAGIWVDWADKPPEVRVGQLVEIRGVTGPGQFAPLVIAKDGQILGKSQLPRSNIFRFCRSRSQASSVAFTARTTCLKHTSHFMEHSP
jgi:hypothetical protein